ncbi:hypothetical protein [Paraclostridium bifermentans]|uniref:hypothetical protein n=1 Tax=Paraclostridium bifermentans TaxID=1490 RepID=UPI00374F8E3A
MSETNNLNGVINERRFYYFTKDIFKRLPQSLVKQDEDINKLDSIMCYNELEVIDLFCNSYISRAIESRDMTYYMDGVNLTVSYIRDNLKLLPYSMDIFVELNKRLNWAMIIITETYNQFRISSKEIWRLFGRVGINYLLNMFEPYHCLPNNLVILKCMYDLRIDFNDINQSEWSEWIFSLNKDQQDDNLRESIELIKKDMWIM